ncbi:MAG: hypothetical protein H0W64_00005 [Gammaproteobacteria bacterium]|nr:hypothetical protein [Gammaproteobacteria bacterium]
MKQTKQEVQKLIAEIKTVITAYETETLDRQKHHYGLNPRHIKQAKNLAKSLDKIDIESLEEQHDCKKALDNILVLLKPFVSPDPTKSFLFGKKDGSPKGGTRLQTALKPTYDELISPNVINLNVLAKPYEPVIPNLSALNAVSTSNLNNAMASINLSNKQRKKYHSKKVNHAEKNSDSTNPIIITPAASSSPKPGLFQNSAVAVPEVVSVEQAATSSPLSKPN